MIKTSVIIISITTTTSLLIYYIYKMHSQEKKDKKENSLRDVQTQTTFDLPSSKTPPNETSQPDFVNIEHHDLMETLPRRSISMASFFNFMRK